MPADSRPGLVMVSNDDMIVALQKQASKAEVRNPENIAKESNYAAIVVIAQKCSNA